MSAPVTRGKFNRWCSCGWKGTYDTAAKAAYARRRHSCERWTAKAAATARHQQRLSHVDRTPKPCLHQQADHKHGTYACYILDYCRCARCCNAHSIYEQNRTRQHAYGRWNGLVDAEPSRQHVRRLMAAGMGLKRIVAVSGISQGLLWKLIYGKRRPDGSQTPSRRVKPETAARILAIELDLADGAFVSGKQTARRIQALVACGWSMSKLCQPLGIQRGNFTPLAHGTGGVTVATAKAVHALYAELVDQPPPETTRQERQAASRARNYATTLGWVKPLRVGGRAWIGPALDLDAEPDAAVLDPDSGYDEAAVQRALDGDRSVTLHQAERIEVVRRARELGWSLNQIVQRTGISRPERYFEAAA